MTAASRSRRPARAGIRRAVVATVAATVLAPGPTPAVAQEGSGTGATLTTIGAETLEGVVACLQERPNLAVAVVVDESGSLRSTDPTDKRAEILAGFLTRLIDLSEAGFDGRDRQVLVTVGYFGGGIDETVPWTPLVADADGRSSIVEEVRAETPDRDRDARTDFRAAIDWATGRIDAVERLVDPASLCTMTLWFSDGELDPDNRPDLPYDRPAVVEATEELCAAGGVVDGHRRTGAALVGIFLFDPTFVTRSESTLPRMHAMVEGVDPAGVRCGTGESRGVYLEGSLDRLSLLFERIITPNQGGRYDDSYAGDPVTFEVDPGVSKVRIAMSAPSGFALETASGAEVVVEEPADETRTSGLDPGVVPDVRWTGTSVSVDLPVRSEDHGIWTVRREGTDSGLDLYFFVDAVIEVAAQEADVRSGEPARFSGRIVTAAGEPVDLDAFGAVRLAIAVDGRPAEVALAGDGAFTASFTVETREARVPARIRLDLTTRGGTALQPVQRDVLLAVTLPGEFPTVRIGEFDRVLGPDGTVARLDVVAVGSVEGPTRVCVRASRPGDAIAEVRDALAVAWSSDGPDLGRCVELGVGEEVEGVLEVALLTPLLVGRRVGIPLEVELISAPVDGRSPAGTTFADLRTLGVEPPPANPWIVAVLLLLGIAIPLLVLWALNRRAGRFRTRNLQSARVPVRVVGSLGALRIERRDGGPLLVRDDFGYLPSGDRGPDGRDEWRFTSDAANPGTVDGEGWRAIVPLNPFGTVRAVVEAPVGHRVRSNVAPTTVPDGTAAGIDLRPQRSAYLLLADDDLAEMDDDGVDVPATLVVILGHESGGMDAAVAAVADRASTSLVEGETVPSLAAAARAVAPTDGVASDGVAWSDPVGVAREDDDDPWGSGDGGGRPPGGGGPGSGGGIPGWDSD